jgi:hypothetical protein
MVKLGEELAFQVDLASAVIAIIALLFSVWTGRRQRRLERETLRLQRDSDIIAWSNACLDNLCRAEMLMRREYAAVMTEHDFERQRYETLAALSSCIDRGRLYFPNRVDGHFGIEKARAFQGHRHPVLDRLVWVYELFSNMTFQSPSDAAAREKVRKQSIDHKREFISEVQSEVDPRRRIAFLEKHG